MIAAPLAPPVAHTDPSCPSPHRCPPPPPALVSPIRASSFSNWWTTRSRMRNHLARATPASKSPKVWACRYRCAKARSKRSSATATSRSACRSTSGSGAATRARRTSRARRCGRRCRRPTTSPASPPRTRLRACPTSRTWHSARLPRATSTFSIRGTSMPSARSRSRRVASAPRWRSIAASPIRRAPASRRSSRISSPATRAAFAAAMRARVIRCRWRRSRRYRESGATTCSATLGTARCAHRKTSLHPKPWAATRPSARCRA